MMTHAQQCERASLSVGERELERVQGESAMGSGGSQLPGSYETNGFRGQMVTTDPRPIPTHHTSRGMRG